jgi:hypothetical protein
MLSKAEGGGGGWMLKTIKQLKLALVLHNKVPRNEITSRHPKGRGQVSVTTKVSGTGTMLEKDRKFDHEEKV